MTPCGGGDGASHSSHRGASSIRCNEETKAVSILLLSRRDPIGVTLTIAFLLLVAVNHVAATNGRGHDFFFFAAAQASTTTFSAAPSSTTGASAATTSPQTTLVAGTLNSGNAQNQNQQTINAAIPAASTTTAPTTEIAFASSEAYPGLCTPRCNSWFTAEAQCLGQESDGWCEWDAGRGECLTDCSRVPESSCATFSHCAWGIYDTRQGGPTFEPGCFRRCGSYSAANCPCDLRPMLDGTGVTVKLCASPCFVAPNKTMCQRWRPTDCVWRDASGTCEASCALERSSVGCASLSQCVWLPTPPVAVGAISDLIALSSGRAGQRTGRCLDRCAVSIGSTAALNASSILSSGGSSNLTSTTASDAAAQASASLLAALKTECARTNTAAGSASSEGTGGGLCFWSTASNQCTETCSALHTSEDACRSDAACDVVFQTATAAAVSGGSAPDSLSLAPKSCQNTCASLAATPTECESTSVLRTSCVWHVSSQTCLRRCEFISSRGDCAGTPHCEWSGMSQRCVQPCPSTEAIYIQASARAQLLWTAFRIMLEYNRSAAANQSRVLTFKNSEELALAMTEQQLRVNDIVGANVTQDLIDLNAVLFRNFASDTNSLDVDLAVRERLCVGSSAAGTGLVCQFNRVTGECRRPCGSRYGSGSSDSPAAALRSCSLDPWCLATQDGQCKEQCMGLGRDACLLQPCVWQARQQFCVLSCSRRSNVLDAIRQARNGTTSSSSTLIAQAWTVARTQCEAFLDCLWLGEKQGSPCVDRCSSVTPGSTSDGGAGVSVSPQQIVQQMLSDAANECTAMPHCQWDEAKAACLVRCSLAVNASMCTQHSAFQEAGCRQVDAALLAEAVESPSGSGSGKPFACLPPCDTLKTAECQQLASLCLVMPSAHASSATSSAAAANNKATSPPSSSTSLDKCAINCAFMFGDDLASCAKNTVCEVVSGRCTQKCALLTVSVIPPAPTLIPTNLIVSEIYEYTDGTTSTSRQLRALTADRCRQAAPWCDTFYVPPPQASAPTASNASASSNQPKSIDTQCVVACSALTSASDCAEKSHCEWSSGSCTVRCSRYLHPADCAAAHDCAWSGGQCHVACRLRGRKRTDCEGAATPNASDGGGSSPASSLCVWTETASASYCTEPCDSLADVASCNALPAVCRYSNAALKSTASRAATGGAAAATPSIAWGCVSQCRHRQTEAACVAASLDCDWYRGGGVTATGGGGSGGLCRPRCSYFFTKDACNSGGREVTPTAAPEDITSVCEWNHQFSQCSPRCEAKYAIGDTAACLADTSCEPKAGGICGRRCDMLASAECTVTTHCRWTALPGPMVDSSPLTTVIGGEPGKCISFCGDRSPTLCPLDSYCRLVSATDCVPVCGLYTAGGRAACDAINQHNTSVATCFWNEMTQACETACPLRYLNGSATSTTTTTVMSRCDGDSACEFDQVAGICRASCFALPVSGCSLASTSGRCAVLQGPRQPLCVVACFHYLNNLTCLSQRGCAWSFGRGVCFTHCGFIPGGLATCGSEDCVYRGNPTLLPIRDIPLVYNATAAPDGFGKSTCEFRCSTRYFSVSATVYESGCRSAVGVPHPATCAWDSASATCLDSCESYSAYQCERQVGDRCQFNAKSGLCETRCDRRGYTTLVQCERDANCEWFEAAAWTLLQHGSSVEDSRSVSMCQQRCSLNPSAASCYAHIHFGSSNYATHIPNFDADAIFDPVAKMRRSLCRWISAGTNAGNCVARCRAKLSPSIIAAGPFSTSTCLSASVVNGEPACSFFEARPSASAAATSTVCVDKCESFSQDYCGSMDGSATGEASHCQWNPIAKQCQTLCSVLAFEPETLGEPAAGSAIATESAASTTASTSLMGMAAYRARCIDPSNSGMCQWSVSKNRCELACSQRSATRDVANPDRCDFSTASARGDGDQSCFWSDGLSACVQACPARLVLLGSSAPQCAAGGGSASSTGKDCIVTSGNIGRGSLTATAISIAYNVSSGLACGYVCSSLLTRPHCLRATVGQCSWWSTSATTGTCYQACTQRRTAAVCANGIVVTPPVSPTNETVTAAAAMTIPVCAWSKEGPGSETDLSAGGCLPNCDLQVWPSGLTTSVSMTTANAAIDQCVAQGSHCGFDYYPVAPVRNGSPETNSSTAPQAADNILRFTAGAEPWWLPATDSVLSFVRCATKCRAIANATICDALVQRCEWDGVRCQARCSSLQRRGECEEESTRCRFAANLQGPLGGGLCVPRCSRVLEATSCRATSVLISDATSAVQVPLCVWSDPTGQCVESCRLLEVRDGRCDGGSHCIPVLEERRGGTLDAAAASKFHCIPRCDVMYASSSCAATASDPSVATLCELATLPTSFSALMPSSSVVSAASITTDRCLQVCGRLSTVEACAASGHACGWSVATQTCVRSCHLRFGSLPGVDARKAACNADVDCFWHDASATCLFDCQNVEFYRDPQEVDVTVGVTTASKAAICRSYSECSWIGVSSTCQLKCALRHIVSGDTAAGSPLSIASCRADPLCEWLSSPTEATIRAYLGLSTPAALAAASSSSSSGASSNPMLFQMATRCVEKCAVALPSTLTTTTSQTAATSSSSSAMCRQGVALPALMVAQAIQPLPIADLSALQRCNWVPSKTATGGRVAATSTTAGEHPAALLPMGQCLPSCGFHFAASASACGSSVARQAYCTWSTAASTAALPCVLACKARLARAACLGDDVSSCQWTRSQCHRHCDDIRDATECAVEAVGVCEWDHVGQSCVAACGRWGTQSQCEGDPRTRCQWLAPPPADLRRALNSTIGAPWAIPASSFGKPWLLVKAQVAGGQCVRRCADVIGSKGESPGRGASPLARRVGKPSTNASVPDAVAPQDRQTCLDQLSAFDRLSSEGATETITIAHCDVFTSNVAGELNRCDVACDLLDYVGCTQRQRPTINGRASLTPNGDCVWLAEQQQCVKACGTYNNVGWDAAIQRSKCEADPSCTFIGNPTSQCVPRCDHPTRAPTDSNSCLALGQHCGWDLAVGSCAMRCQFIRDAASCTVRGAAVFAAPLGGGRGVGSLVDAPLQVAATSSCYWHPGAARCFERCAHREKISASSPRSSGTTVGADECTAPASSPVLTTAAYASGDPNSQLACDFVASVSRSIRFRLSTRRALDVAAGRPVSNASSIGAAWLRTWRMQVADAFFLVMTNGAAASVVADGGSEQPASVLSAYRQEIQTVVYPPAASPGDGSKQPDDADVGRLDGLVSVTVFSSTRTLDRETASASISTDSAICELHQLDVVITGASSLQAAAVMRASSLLSLNPSLIAADVVSFDPTKQS